MASEANKIRRLYCTNLPDKLRKYDLRLSLYTLFSTYGTILDVVAMNTSKMRGQAHIVFKDVQASTQAMRALQGFEFFGKEMVGCKFHKITILPHANVSAIRKLFMAREPHTSLADFVVHTLRPPQEPDLAEFRPIFRNPSSVALRAQSLHDRLKLMESRTEQSELGRRKVMKKKPQWRKTVMCPWKPHLMRKIKGCARGGDRWRSDPKSRSKCSFFFALLTCIS